MIDPIELRAISEARLQDARVLFANGRYDGTAYICGYSLETSLKARICDTLNWPGYPGSPGEFSSLASFKVHNLNTLLLLSGRETYIKQNCYSDWSIVREWKPEARYNVVGLTSSAQAGRFLQATRDLLQRL